MKIITTYEKHEPDTLGYSITIKYTYVGTEEEIKEVEEFCKTSIGGMTVCNEN